MRGCEGLACGSGRPPLAAQGGTRCVRSRPARFGCARGKSSAAGRISRRADVSRLRDYLALRLRITRLGSSAGSERASAAPSSSEGDVESDEVVLLLRSPLARRRVAQCESPEECIFDLHEQLQAGDLPPEPGGTLSMRGAEALFETLLEAGKPQVATELFSALSRGSANAFPIRWDGLEASALRTSLLLSLTRSLYVDSAMELVKGSFSVSLRGAGRLSFGRVVKCAYCSFQGTNQSLAVVKPHQGEEVARCASCQYEYELFSGEVVRSESDTPGEDQVFGGIFSGGKVAAATHIVDVKAPGGATRTYKFSTATNEVPARVGDRVTMMSGSQTMPTRGLLRPVAPGWSGKAGTGKAKGVHNHVSGRVVELLDVPREGPDPLAQFLVPVGLLLAAGDAASGVLSPDLPVLLASGAVGVAAAALVTKEVLLPRLSKINPKQLTAVQYRQQFLEQYDTTRGKLDALLASTLEDVQLLGRLWQLHHKIEAVGGAGAYEARVKKVLSSARDLERRLAGSMDLIAGYAKVASMIEIEIELEQDVDAAEARSAMVGIEEEVDKLSELEELKSEWAIQVEAKDEIERLLSSPET